MHKLTKFEGRLQSLHNAENNTLKWLETIAIIAVTK